MIVSALLLLPVHLAVVFATILVGWYGQPAPKALFFGAFAVWRNRAPILFNLLALSGLAVAAVFTAASAFLLAGLDKDVAQLMLLPVLLMLPPLANASYHAMVQDVVRADDEPAASPSAPPQPGAAGPG